LKIVIGTKFSYNSAKTIIDYSLSISIFSGFNFTMLKVACNAGVFWRAIERIFTERAQFWIHTRKRLGERREGVLRSKREITDLLDR